MPGSASRSAAAAPRPAPSSAHPHPVPPPGERPTRFAAALLAWFDAHRRDLPWRRRQHQPWAVWVSEIMLQQTRVETVREPYGRFLERFPDPATFATCSDDELQEAWRGLGYYRRARLLREGARAVVRDHGGEVPADPDSLRALPGIGAYTLGAVGSIAFGHPIIAVDGNVERVAARHEGIDTNVKRQPGAGRVRAFAQRHLDRDRPGDFNQAMMELGATVCTPRNPSCQACPVADDCHARTHEATQELPVLPARRAPIAIDTTLLAVPLGHGLLAYELPAGEPNAGQWELPGPGLTANAGDDDELADTIAARCSARIEPGARLGRFSHGITHHRISVAVRSGELHGPRGRLHPRSPTDPAVPWTTASRKAFAVLGVDAAG